MSSDKHHSKHQGKKDNFEPDFAKFTHHELQQLRNDITQLYHLHSELLPKIISHYRVIEKMTDEQRKSVDSIRTMLKEMKDKGQIKYNQTGQSTMVPASTHFNPGIVFYPGGNIDNPTFYPVVPEKTFVNPFSGIVGVSSPESSPNYNEESE